MPQFPVVKGLTVMVAATALAACSTITSNPALPQGEAAYQIIPANAPSPESYLVVPGDVLTIDVFGEADVSKPQILVDSAGKVQIPLAGEFKASGLTTTQLASQIAGKLGSRYLVNPQVTVAVLQPAKRYVAVEGDVKTPGVYEIGDKFTLLAALARAQSPSETAKLNEVIVFRTIGGQRMAARFNLKDIRGGLAPDPEIMDGDVVTIGRSPAKSAWQDILRAAPIFNAFIMLSNNNN